MAPREMVPKDELEMFEQLTQEGLRCGVHDPDFSEPLDSTLHLLRGGTVTKLECEDTTLSFDLATAKLRVEPRDDVGAGLGLAFYRLPDNSELRMLIFDSDDERQTLISILSRIRADPRAFRRGSALLGCLPAGCVPTCSRKQRQQAPSPSPAPSPEPADGKSGGKGGRTGIDAGKAQDERPPSHGSSMPSAAKPPSAATATSHRSSNTAVIPVDESSIVSRMLESAKKHTRQQWDEMLADTQVKTRRPSVFSIAGSTVQRISKGNSSEQLTSGERMDTDRCAKLLTTVICSSGDMPSPYGIVDLFRVVDGGVSFEDFWAVCVQMLLADVLWAEMECKFETEEDSGDAVRIMAHKQWDWFLVQDQKEEANVIEASQRHLGAMESPEVVAASGGAKGGLTLFGLSRQLCTLDNSVFSRERCCVHEEDMSHPLTEYWIAASHHVYSDLGGTSAPSSSPPGTPSPRSPGKLEDDDIDDELQAIRSSLRAGCRCIYLALVAGARGELQVLLQRRRLSLDSVLGMLSDAAFEKLDFPLLLVVALALLPPARCAAVPAALQVAFGDRLWSPKFPDIPSPAEARGRVVIVLAPAAVMSDPSLDVAIAAEVPLENGGAISPRGRQNPSPLGAWQDAMEEFAVWPGCAFDMKLPQRSAQEVSLNFLPCDDLLTLEPSAERGFCEYSRQHLTLAYPVCTRFAVANFNACSAWHLGIQMVGISLCAGDSAVVAHAGRFGEDNGGCGYVLKPKHLRRGASEASSLTELQLELRVLGARGLPGLKVGNGPEGLVTIVSSIWGAQVDSASQHYKPVRPAGPTITWPDSKKAWKFSISSPTTAVLAIEILELDSVTGKPSRIAAFAAPVDGLRSGLRWAQLWDPKAGSARPTRRGQLCGLLLRLDCEAREARRCVQ